MMIFEYYLNLSGLKLLFVFATTDEASVMKSLFPRWDGPEKIYAGDSEITVLVTGVGSMATSWGMLKWLHSNPLPDYAINAGIAGSYNDKLTPGTVVIPITDCFADLGIEKNGSFLTLPEAGFAGVNDDPFSDGVIKAGGDLVRTHSLRLPAVRAVTVNMTSGSEISISRIRDKFNPDIETMEGATFFYICAREKIPFLAVRAISNMVEPVRLKPWNIRLALDNLALETGIIIKSLF